jgi:hypothetical protein
LKIDFPNDVSFVEPQSHKLPGVLHACVMEWAMITVNLLGLTREEAVREQLIQILKELANEPRGLAR